MGQLMRFYLLDKRWRARLAMNSYASWIFTCWLYAALLALGGIIGCLLGTANGIVSLGMLGASLLCVLVSYRFLPDARQVHHIRILAKNAVFEGEISENK